jgi:formate-nitrite transporter family protein
MMPTGTEQKEQGQNDGGSESAPSAGTRFSASEIHENIRVAAEEELERPIRELIWSSLSAGLTIGFSFLGAAYLSSLVAAPYREAAAAAGYPLGFIFVVLARHQLFTENTLEPVVPLLNKRNMETLRKVLRLWSVVLVGNLIGACLLALVASRTPMLQDQLRGPLVELAAKTTSGGFWVVAYKAIFAGWLVALMAWLVASTHATGAQIALIWLTTAPIAAFGFRHSIAGAVEAFYLAASGISTWGTAVGEFLVPAVLGNVVGGVILVALLNYGQVGD